MNDPEVRALVDRLFRRESGRLVARLARILGAQDLHLAEEVVQDALLRALEVWPFRGVPPDPSAWLATAARNRALDVLRRQARLRAKAAEVEAALGARASGGEAAGGDAALDDELAMMFLCAHPALPPEARTALTLKTVGGLGVAEIARAFLASEPAVAQRLVRAKRQIRAEGLQLQLPSPRALPGRLDSVLEVIYLMFNEGHAACGGPDLVRADLCAEAIRLGRLVARHPVAGCPAAHALLALMLLHAARLPARVDAIGDLRLLADQDRARWDRALLAEGFQALERCADGPALTTYHLQAGIAAAHAAAGSEAETDWPHILALYERLSALDPSPVVALNRAVALAQCAGAEAGLAALQALECDPALASYHHLPAAAAELCRRLDRGREAAAFYRRALALGCSEPERRFLNARLAEVEAPTTRT